MYNSISVLSILNGLSRTLNIANQMIPIYKQLKPIISNSSKIINSIKYPSTKNTQTTPSSNVIQSTNNNYDSYSLPTFFQ